MTQAAMGSHEPARNGAATNGAGRGDTSPKQGGQNHMSNREESGNVTPKQGDENSKSRNVEEREDVSPKRGDENHASNREESGDERSTSSDVDEREDVSPERGDENHASSNGDNVQESIEEADPSELQTVDWSAADALEDALDFYLYGYVHPRSGSPTHTEVGTGSAYGWPNGLDMGGSRPSSPASPTSDSPDSPPDASSTPELEREERSVSPSPECDVPETPSEIDRDPEDLDGDEEADEDENGAVSQEDIARARRRLQAGSQVYRINSSYDGASDEKN